MRSLPPISEAFAEKVKRAHLQTYIWKAALEDHPHLDVATFGWQKDELSQCLSPVVFPPGKPVTTPGILQMVKCGYTY